MRKKKFLGDVRMKLKSIGMPNDKINQIIDEIEVMYNVEEERGKSHSDIVANRFISAREVADKYGKIFGYGGKNHRKDSSKFTKDISKFTNYGYNKRNKKLKYRSKPKKESLSKKMDEIILNFLEELASDSE